MNEKDGPLPEDFEDPRLSSLLKAARPHLSRADSERLWAGIRARIQAQPVPLRPEPWYAFLTRPWAPAWSWGLGAAAAAVVVVLLVQPAQPPQAVESDEPAPAAVAMEQKEEAAPALAKAAKSAPERASRQEAPAQAPVPADVAKDEAVPAGSGLTEVERALAESDAQVDRMIEAFLAQGPQARLRAPAMAQANTAMSLAPRASFAAFDQAGTAGFGARSSRQHNLGTRDQDGFWDWRPAAVAMNQRDWSQAQIELEAAMLQAGEASERSFAASALTLLSAQGGPLEGQASSLPESGELRVLGAGRWQLAVDERLARFSQGVSARLPGFRVEGDSLVLDLTFDRGSFGPGTRFTRVADPRPARVVDAADQAVGDSEFSAPQGAVYNVQERELRLR